MAELKSTGVAVGGPLASELPMEDKASVLGVAELKLVPEALAAVLVISTTPTELAVGEAEIKESGALRAEETVLEVVCGASAP